jgi:hypothetical protein
MAGELVVDTDDGETFLRLESQVLIMNAGKVSHETERACTWDRKSSYSAGKVEEKTDEVCSGKKVVYMVEIRITPEGLTYLNKVWSGGRLIKDHTCILKKVTS